MEKVNRASWAILSPDEKTALGLQHGMNKSSWESGEIMDKSHYKYLEIKYRAEKFLAMFTEHFDLYGSIIPEYVTGEGSVKMYIKLSILNRKKPMEVLEALNDNENDVVYTKSSMNAKIITQLRKWEKSENVHELSVYNLVKEFDRWNNYRILPREVQEPSAFKRRIKNMYKKHIRVLTTMPELSRNKLLSLTKPNKKDPNSWMPLLLSGKFEIFKVRVNKNTLKFFNDFCLYLFTDKIQAETYIKNVHSYVHKAQKDCKDGIQFWQIYRDCIKTADNYNEVQKITATRSHLEMAYNNLTYYNQK